ncbi:HD domain-containing protein [Streptomyces coelicoflavus]|uniref:HD domain-containing protein n=1 Tax=Streptomyces coelicoflavus TaxID=285562 RepID=UPI0024AE4168|nr:HD domain-containing protein [Streptomyces coelicoflavus]MDI6520325.1 HD domain-containing protein [Streptomyces coelicoflavus]
MTHDDLLSLPDTPLARAALNLVVDAESASIANHSIRSFLFARLVARSLGMVPGHDHDERLLFLACVLHDLGLAPEGRHTQRFEVVGADRAAEFLTAQGLPAAEVDAVWEAVALHTTPQIAERRGALSLLVREGICVDFGGVIGPGVVADAVTDEEARAIHDAHPRLSMVSSIVEAMATQAAKHPANGPRYSVGGELLRERGNPPRRTRMEEAVLTSRWRS